MTNAPRGSGLSPDLAALRRYLWLPIASLAVAVAVALAIGSLTSDSSQARFRANVVVDSLPPLFGPAVLPGPFDYARVATSEPVLDSVAQSSGVPADQLKPRMTAEVRLNRTEIDFKVTGANALVVARAWQQAFTDEAMRRTPDLERQLVQPYSAQLEQGRAQLVERSTAAKAAPDDPVAQQQLKAAEENYETASKLAQSYEVVATTMKSQVFTVMGPHMESAGVGSRAGRFGAAVAVGLLVGVFGALLLDYAGRRRTPTEDPIDRAPAPLRRGTGSSTR